ncbi:MAG TPA: M24 family metallopeptidase [Rhizomicrobium sp.]|nr:M24 family metallopeptidase [Rhizomicrobium sp.]
MSETNEQTRRAALIAAEKRAEELLAEIEAAGFVAPGRRESEVEEDIRALAEARFGVERHWHRRIVRAGINTLTTAGDYPPERVIAAEDTVYVDLGPVFAEWEADIGRTYALGGDPAKNKLVADLPRVFARVQSHYYNSPQITGAELYAFALAAAADEGWAFGGTIAGHIVGEFSHMTLPGDRDLNRISPKNPTRMRSNDTLGRPKHWILEIHLVNHARTFGGFYERLL